MSAFRFGRQALERKSRITDKSILVDHDIWYYSIIDINDTSSHKVALITALPNVQLKRNKKPYPEEIVPHIFHLHNEDAVRAEISCPRCEQRMEHYIDYNKQAVYLCNHCL